MESSEILTQGGIYLARLDPIKAGEVGKRRPVVVITGQYIIDMFPPVIMICPLSSQSNSLISYLHVEIEPRENLHRRSYALVEHCRSVARKRIQPAKLATLEPNELGTILSRLQRLLGA